MGKSGSAVTVGHEYYLGLHFVLCHGVVDSLSEIQFDSRVAFKGEASETTITIDKPGLYGGDGREGGVSGDIDIINGELTQGQNPYLFSLLGSTLPSFRGVMSVIFNKFYVGNNPYLKDVKFRVSRIHSRKTNGDQWYDSKAAINESRQYGLASSVFDVDAGYQGGQGNGGQFAGNYFAFTPDGLTCGMTNINGYFWQITLTKAFDLNTANYISSSSYKVLDYTPYSGFGQAGWCAWTNTGDFIFLFTAGGIDRIQYVELGTPFNVDSTKTIGLTIEPSLGIISPITKFSDSGFRVWVLETPGGIKTLYEYSLTTPFILSNSNATFITQSLANIDIGIRSLDWSTSGDVLYVASFQNLNFKGIKLYKPISPFNITGMDLTINNTTWISSLDTSPEYDGNPDIQVNDQIGKIFYTSSLASNTKDGLGQYFIGNGYYSGDMNPVHIIREAITDPDWGLGFSETLIDDPNFKSVADTLFTESMGISLVWSGEMPVQEFIQEIIRHIDGVLYVDLITGLFTLKLIRNDYIIGSLITLDETNIIDVKGLKRTAFGELVNQVTIRYYNILTDEERSVSEQDVSLVREMGFINGTTITYAGFTNSSIASKIASRDLIGLSTPLNTVELTTNRVASILNVGDPVNVDWPNLKITGVYRITEIAFGEHTNNEILLRLTEDVFYLPTTAITNQIDPEEQPLSPVPVPMVNEYMAEIPYLELIRIYRQAQIDEEIAGNPNFGLIGGNGDSPLNGILTSQMWSDDGSGYKNNGLLRFSSYAALNATISYLDTTMDLTGMIFVGNVRLGSYCVIDNEFISFESLNLNIATIRRGILDTMPAVHSAGSKVFFIEDGWNPLSQEFVNGESINIKNLPQTGTQVIDIADATILNVILNQRALRPYPPQNVRFSGTNIYYPVSIGLTDTLIIDWAHRNRLQQTGGVHLSFVDGDVTPEAGLTYTLRIYGDGGTLKRTVSALTGTTYTYLQVDEMADNGGVLNTALLIELESVVNALVCLTIYNYSFTRA